MRARLRLGFAMAGMLSLGIGSEGTAQDTGGPPSISHLCPEGGRDGDHQFLVAGKFPGTISATMDGELVTVVVICERMLHVKGRRLDPGSHTLVVSNSQGTASAVVLITMEGDIAASLSCLSKGLDEALTAGCITKEGTVTSLKVKLANALKAFNAGKNKVALEAASAVLTELRAAQGVDENFKSAFSDLLDDFVLFPLMIAMGQSGEGKPTQTTTTTTSDTNGDGKKDTRTTTSTTTTTEQFSGGETRTTVTGTVTTEKDPEQDGTFVQVGEPKKIERRTKSKTSGTKTETTTESDEDGD